jgi:hypothetical protein
MGFKASCSKRGRAPETDRNVPVGTGPDAGAGMASTVKPRMIRMETERWNNCFNLRPLEEIVFLTDRI